MNPEDIPEDREESYPCECGGNIILDNKTMIWECDNCDVKHYNKKSKTKKKRSNKNEKFEI